MMANKSASKEVKLVLPDIKKRDKDELIEGQKKISTEELVAGNGYLEPDTLMLPEIKKRDKDELIEGQKKMSMEKMAEGSHDLKPVQSSSCTSFVAVAETLSLATLVPFEEESREQYSEESSTEEVEEEQINEHFPEADESGSSEEEQSSDEFDDKWKWYDDDDTTDDDSEDENSEDEDSEDEDSEDEDSEDEESEDEITDDGESEDDGEDKSESLESDGIEQEQIEEPEEPEEPEKEGGDERTEEIDYKFVVGPPLQGAELLKHVEELITASQKAEEEEERKKPKEPVMTLFTLVCDPDCSCKIKKPGALQKPNLYRVLTLKLRYSKHPNLSIEEFMGMTLPKMKLSADEESITRKILADMIYHEKFTTAIANQYYQYRDIRDTRDRHILEVILYVVLLRLKQSTYKTILKTVCKLDPLRGFRIVRYISLPDTPSSIQYHAYKFYGHEFVMKKIMKPLTPEIGFIPKLLADITRFLDSKKPKPTVPIEMKVLERSMKPSAFQEPEKHPKEEILDYKPLPPRPVPKSTHHPPIAQRKLGELKLQNKSEALKLLQEAQKLAFKCAAPKSLPKVKEPPSVHKIRAAPIPDFSKPPPVKKTTATVLREAARYMQDDIKATQLLKHLESGGANMEMYKLLEREIRKQREQEELEAVERKHLQGLLTREEALLARQALLKERKQQMKQFMLEHEEWERQLEELRALEEEKILAIKTKTQIIEQGARDRLQELQQKKHDMAQEIVRETRALLEQTIKEREAELAQRMEMIREMRALHELKCLQNKEKEVDFTEPPGLGLIGEMSLAELRERLVLMRMELQDQENERRSRIQEEKERMRALVQNTEQYIRNIHSQKELIKKQMKKVSTAEEKRLDSPALQKLREKIEDARQQRMALAAATLS